jgi:tRNA dimethylallyltransferase
VHALGTVRDTRVVGSSLRSQRVVGRGAPEAVAGLADEVFAIFGPTASGKSEVARALALRLGTEVVSADALQVYRGLPILTNQPSAPTRLVAIRDLSETMSVGEFATLAHDAIDALVESYGTAVVAGGTGLYLRAALVDLRIPPPVDRNRRARLEQLYDEDPDRAFERLRAYDPMSAAAVHAHDRRRVIRALELAETGKSLTPDVGRLWSTETRRPTLVVGLEVSEEQLGRRIDTRTDGMIARGVVEEVASALQTGVSPTAEQALGLRELATLPLDDARARIVTRTRQYAAYQRKWMRRVPGIVLVDAEQSPEQVVDAILDVARAR